MNFTLQQKKAIVKVLLDMVCADGKTTVGEAFYFDQLKKELSVTDSECIEAARINTFDALLILRNMPDREKTAVMFMLHQMMKSDNVVEFEEMKIFAIVCAGIDIKNPVYS